MDVGLWVSFFFYVCRNTLLSKHSFNFNILNFYFNTLNVLFPLSVVEFKDEEFVKKALETMNKYDLSGRPLNIKEVWLLLLFLF